MDKKIIKGIIDEKLEVIRDQFSIIREYEGKIPAIELDLIMASIRDLYELVLSLQVENISMAIPKETPAVEEHKVTPPPSPVAEEEPAEVIPGPVNEPVERPAETKAPPPVVPVTAARFSTGIISMEPVIEEKPVPEPEPQPEPEPEPEPEPDPQPEKPQRITFDLFSDGTGNILADRFREGQEKRIADKFQENKIVDLRTTIGINDKFLFINELFEGNMRIYDEVLQKLNSAVTMAQAELLMLDLKIAYNWDSESPTVKKFVELVRRKF